MEPQQPSPCCNRLTRSHRRLYQARSSGMDPQQAPRSAITRYGATTAFSVLPPCCTEPQQALPSAIIRYGPTTGSRKRGHPVWSHNRLYDARSSGMEPQQPSPCCNRLTRSHSRLYQARSSGMEPQQALRSAVISCGATTGSTMRDHPVWSHNRLYQARSSGMEPQQPSRCCNRLTRSHSRLYEARLPHTDPQQALGSAIISCGATTGSRKRLPVGWRHDRLLQVLHSGME